MDKLKEYYYLVYQWLLHRVGEKSTVDGIMIVLLCLAIIFSFGLIKYLAWFGIGYGVYTIVKSDVINW